MSREPELPRGGPDQDPDDRPPPTGRVRTTSAAAVAGFAVVGLVLGWLLRPVSVAINGTAPTVGWLPAVTLLFVALVVGWLAWSTFRTVHRRRGHLEPHHAVNRLVLAKACTLGGALVAGAYAGYAISWVGLTEALLARQRMLHAALAALAGAALVIGALLLERACRTRRDDR